MARKPKKRTPAIGAWVHFFVGSPKRFMWTSVGLFVLFAMVAPNLTAQALANVLNAFILAFGPSAGPLLSIAIAVGGIWLMVRVILPKKR